MCVHPFSCWVAAYTAQRCVAQCAALYNSAQRCTARSIAQCPARRVAQENALHVPCDHTARSISKCPALHCIANIVQRSVLAAVSPQVKPSAAASGGTAQRSMKHCQCSNDSERSRRCARLQNSSCSMRPYSAQYYCTVPSATSRARKRPTCTMRPYSAQHITVLSATLHR